MNPPPRTTKHRAQELLSKLDDNISVRELLYSLHQNLTLDQEIDFQRQIHQASSRAAAQKPSWFSEAFGCAAPVLIIAVVFASMPILFQVGEKILGSNPRVIAKGTITKLVLTEPKDGDAYRGQDVRVLTGFLEIGSGSTKVLIPNDKVVGLTIEEK